MIVIEEKKAYTAVETIDGVSYIVVDYCDGNIMSLEFNKDKIRKIQYEHKGKPIGTVERSILKGNPRICDKKLQFRDKSAKIKDLIGDSLDGSKAYEFLNEFRTIPKEEQDITTDDVVTNNAFSEFSNDDLKAFIRYFKDSCNFMDMIFVAGLFMLIAGIVLASYLLN